MLQLSLGGSALRVRFSNEFGNGPLTIAAARVARAAGLGAISGSDLELTFEGRRSVTIPPGRAVFSDALTYEVAAFTPVMVTVAFDSVPSDVTGHPGSRTTSFLAEGNQPSAPDLSTAARVERWYVLSGVEVRPSASLSRAPAVIVTLGNSITDGRGSGTDRNNRWPDNLARRLQANAVTNHIAVLNAGIGGNCVIRGCLGPPALERLERDVLSQRGARWLIVLEGVNDIGGARSAEAAATVQRELIAAYRDIIARARARGLTVYGATILPFAGSSYDSPEREGARQAVNQWIRTSGAFDAVIDFDAVMRDPRNPTRLREDVDTGDHLHPNEAGYRLMAEAIDLNLFRR
jgi:lysophospholipase L1-like esterase